MRNIQGVSFEILQFQMAVAQKLCIFDPMLKKPKRVFSGGSFFTDGSNFVRNSMFDCWKPKIGWSS